MKKFTWTTTKTYNDETVDIPISDDIWGATYCVQYIKNSGSDGYSDFYGMYGNNLNTHSQWDYDESSYHICTIVSDSFQHDNIYISNKQLYLGDSVTIKKGATFIFYYFG